MYPEITSIQVKRKKFGLTQKELADAVKVSQSLITKLESGKLEPSYSIACRIFRFLDEYYNIKEKICKDVMTRHVIFVECNKEVGAAIKLMKSKGISQIPVKDGNEFVGVISESILYSLLESGKGRDNLFSMKCCDVMESAFPILDELTPVSSVLPLLKFYNALLLRNESNKKVVGILTKSNLF